MNNITYASGIQYTGLTDNTESNNPNAMKDALIIGIFKRGRSDRPMVINSSNIRAKLGYDPRNPYYIAVQSALDYSQASVRVLRIGEPNKKCCDKAISVDCDCSSNLKQVTIDCNC